MKTFKLVDVWVNVMLIAGFVIVSLIKMDATFIYGYFIVGAWQITSMLVHHYNSIFCAKGSIRAKYHKAVIVILCTALAGIVIPPLLYVLLVVMIFAAPVMAVCYTWLCYHEVYVKMQRPLSVLK